MHRFKKLERDGYLVIDQVLPESSILRIERKIDANDDRTVGSRNFLRRRWCRDVIAELRGSPGLRGLLPSLAVQCTLFHKSLQCNWLVPLHRDKSVPVLARRDVAGWSGWSVKEDIDYVQPPFEFMTSLVALRLNLDSDRAQSGSLAVVPGSHVGIDGGPVVPVRVPRGGAALMRPTLLHKSSKLSHGRRRVLHFLFGPPGLPGSLEWADAT